jgi:hypothetical protein
MNGREVVAIDIGRAGHDEHDEDRRLDGDEQRVGVADCLIPITSSADTSSTMTAAGRLKRPGPAPGGAASAAGIVMPRSRAKLTKYPDQPTATVETLSAYSRIRSQPMIQAKSSPTVA